MKKFLIILIIAIILVSVWFFQSSGNNADLSSIVTFDQCVEAGNPIMESFPERCRTSDGLLFINWRGAGQFCIQVITAASDPETGDTRDFPTPCDVPVGWIPLN